jgi:hypothetical protein
VAHTLLALSVEAGLPLNDAALVANRAIPNARIQGDSMWLGGVLQAVALGRGRLREAVELWTPGNASPAAQVVGAFGTDEADRSYIVWLAINFPGLDSAGKATADSLERWLRSGRIPDPWEQARSDAWPDSLYVPCVIEAFRISTGDTVGVRDRITPLEPRLEQLSLMFFCLPAVEALLETRADPEGPSPALDRVETLVAGGSWSPALGTVGLVRLRRERGEYERALTLARKRWRGTGNSFTGITQYLKEEGDLSAILADTAGAVRAYEHYLILRDAPDDLARPQVDSVRASLRALQGGGRGS